MCRPPLKIKEEWLLSQRPFQGGYGTCGESESILPRQPWGLLVCSSHGDLISPFSGAGASFKILFT